MINISGKSMAGLIRKYRLEPSLRRDISLLGYSVVFAGYKNILPELIGFTYGAFGVIWRKDECWSMVDPDDISRKVYRFLSRDSKRLDGILLNAMALFRETRDYFEAVKNKKMTAKGLADFLDVYEKYYGALGVYNVFFRAVNIDNHLMISPDLLERIGRERNQAAELFPEIEVFLKLAVREVGRELGVDGRLILNSIFSEARSYLRADKLTPVLIREIKKRVGHCFYLYIFKSGDEYMASDRKGIERVYHDFFDSQAGKVNLIKGQSVYPGKVRGRVKIILPSYNLNRSNFSKGDILIATHTNPHIMPLIKKATAIITDEGGLLSHAAVLSREFKIPCVIGAKIATKVLKDGDLVEVDANKGIVKVIKSQ